MGTTAYEVAFTATDFLRFRIVSERGRVVSFTVQYEIEIDDKTYPVVRYDTAHGDAHRDLLDHEGRNIDKHWLPGWDYQVALQYARADLVANWPRYRADFIRRMP